MEKKTIRSTILSGMRQQDLHLKQEKDQALLQELISRPAYQEAKVIATYLSMPHEFESKLLIEQALADGKTILVPKTFPKGRMIFVPYDPDQLVPSSFGLMEPISEEAFPMEDIDLIHVPGLAFDNQGYRIGYGAGYYDRYLANYQGKTISTIYQIQEADFPVEAHDIPVQEVICR